MFIIFSYNIFGFFHLFYQVEHLSILYDLQYSIEDKNKVALTKTLFTKQADKDALRNFLGRIVKLK